MSSRFRLSIRSPIGTDTHFYDIIVRNHAFPSKNDETKGFVPISTDTHLRMIRGYPYQGVHAEHVDLVVNSTSNSRVLRLQGPVGVLQCAMPQRGGSRGVYIIVIVNTHHSDCLWRSTLRSSCIDLRVTPQLIFILCVSEYCHTANRIRSKLAAFPDVQGVGAHRKRTNTLTGQTHVQIVLDFSVKSPVEFRP